MRWVYASIGVASIFLCALALLGMFYHAVYVPLDGTPVTLVTKVDTYTVRYWPDYGRIDITGNLDACQLSSEGSQDFCAEPSGGYVRFAWDSTGSRYAKAKYWYSTVALVS